MSICFVIFYAGELPVWFDAFMLSCQKNKQINWLIFTDSTIPEHYPDNIKFEYLTLKQFNLLARDIVKINVDVQHPYKLCDYKALYGDIFKEYLTNYEYWGHCDLDLVWGNLQGFFKAVEYKQFDIVTTRRNAISGHCTIYKNNETLYKLYREIDNFWKPLEDKQFAGVNEGIFSYYVYTIFKETNRFKIYWPKNYGIHRYTLNRKPLGWYWKESKIYSKKGKQHLYLHFMNWKKSVQKMDFTYSDQPEKFYINRTGIFNKEENVKFDLNNYPIKTPFYALKHQTKKILKIKPKELSNYHPDYLKIEQRYPS